MKTAESIVDDYAIEYNIGWEFKALLARLLVKEFLSEKQVKNIITSSKYKTIF